MGFKWKTRVVTNIDMHMDIHSYVDIFALIDDIRCLLVNNIVNICVENVDKLRFYFEIVMSSKYAQKAL